MGWLGYHGVALFTELLGQLDRSGVYHWWPNCGASAERGLAMLGTTSEFGSPEIRILLDQIWGWGKSLKDFRLWPWLIWRHLRSISWWFDGDLMMMFGAFDTDGRTNGFPHVSWDQWALVVFSGGDKFGEASLWWWLLAWGTNQRFQPTELNEALRNFRKNDENNWSNNCTKMWGSFFIDGIDRGIVHIEKDEHQDLWERTSSTEMAYWGCIDFTGGNKHVGFTNKSKDWKGTEMGK